MFYYAVWHRYEAGPSKTMSIGIIPISEQGKIEKSLSYTMFWHTLLKEQHWALRCKFFQVSVFINYIQYSLLLKKKKDMTTHF